MQSIYDSGIGSIDEYKSDNGGHVFEVKKEQNRRNPSLVIALANKLRTDGIIQKPSSDMNAPNMCDGHIREGKISFLYSDTFVEYEKVRTYVEKHFKWNFTDAANTKELNLTHSMIASKGGFPNLMEIFGGDKILDYCSKIKKELANLQDDVDAADLSFGVLLSVLSERYGEKIIKPTAGQEDYISAHPILWEKAKSENFAKLSKMFIEQDQLIDDKKQDEQGDSVGSKRARVISHLFKLQEIINLYNQNKIGEFLKATDKQCFRSVSEKNEIKEAMIELTNSSDITIGEFISKANDLNIYPIDERLNSYMENYSYVYDRVASVSYAEFLQYYDYMEGRTPFSTQHRTKGSEYDNVLVLMESKWNKYNFGYLMGDSPVKKSTSYDSIVNRTRKLFYVCCTRTKNHLVVFYASPSPKVLETAIGWFGEENVNDINE
jgi:DNA helicase-2/ATP-dependent DNA helicase PcrA